MPAKQTHPDIRSAGRGFTLIELLTSMAISSIILLFLFGLINQSSVTYKNTQSAVNTLSESRAFYHFFETDLSSRLPNTPLLSEVSPSGYDKIGVIRVKSFDEPRVANAPDSDLRSSVYYVAFTQDLRGAVSPKLYRSYMDAAQTQALIDSSPTPTIPAGNPAVDEPLVYNVVSFKAQPRQLNSAGQPEPWTPTSAQPPAFVEITLELIDDGTAARFRSQGSWAQLAVPNSRERLQNVRTYTQTIQLAR
jgi:prepilin-type N-terminal cleavage/methylation domain-containing protein